MFAPKGPSEIFEIWGGLRLLDLGGGEISKISEGPLGANLEGYDNF